MTDRWLLALRAIYILGLVVAILLTFTGTANTGPRYELLGGYSGAFRYFGMGHMIVLIALSFKVSKPGKQMAGAKIQTAGYLHTLLGFVAALLVFNSDDSKQLSTLMVLLGLALGTSIVGWAFGSEIADAGAPSGRRGDFLDDKMGEVAGEFERFAEDVRRVNAEYVAALRGAVAELKTEADTLNRAKNVAAELGEKLLPVAELSGTILKNLRELALRSGEARDGLADTATAARDTAKYLKESRVLIVELERLLDFVRDRPGGARYGRS